MAIAEILTTNISTIMRCDQVGKKLVSDFNQALEEHGVNLRVYAIVSGSLG